MQGYRPVLFVAAVFLVVFAASYGFLQLNSSGETGASAPPAKETASPPSSETASLPPPIEPPITAPEPTAPEPIEDEFADIAPGAGVPAGGSAMPPAASADPPGSGVPMAPSSTAPGDAPSPAFDSGGGGTSAMPPAAYDLPPPPPPPPPPPSAALPPAAANGHTPVTPVVKNGHSGSKVLSYFQHAKTKIDTSKAFGFVLLPKAAVTAEEKQTQKQFCEIILATMDFMTPGAIAAAPTDILATYWPIVGSRESFEIKAAFTDRNCDELIAWYDHKLARGLATKAGVAGLTGPLLITWPSSGADGEEARNPLIVDFSKANHERATKALQYWFRQLCAKPELWTNRIREGTIRAELADAVNDTAGVVLAVLHGKWDSLNAVSATP